jgi:hypothetical protein
MRSIQSPLVLWEHPTRSGLFCSRPKSQSASCAVIRQGPIISSGMHAPAAHDGPPRCRRRSLHARPVIQATSADLDKGQHSFSFPVAQSPAAHGQPDQQLLFINETWFAPHAVFQCVQTGWRRDSQKIFLFTIHATETLCEAESGRVCHTRGISRAGARGLLALKIQLLH